MGIGHLPHRGRAAFARLTASLALLVAGPAAADPGDPVGACCIDDPAVCAEITEAECAGLMGEYHGDGTSCDAVECFLPEPVGACCRPDFFCEETTQDACLAQGGDFQGDGTWCEIPFCCAPAGACCLPDATCEDLTPLACHQAGGRTLGPGTLCTPDTCGQIDGACCRADGTCQTDTEYNCTTLGGAYQGDGTECEVDLCPEPPGACCLPGDACVEALEDDCAAQGGAWQGGGTGCATPCGPTGACCFPGIAPCEMISLANCEARGGWATGAGVDCASIECPPLGRCCFADGPSDILPQGECEALGGTYQGEEGSCGNQVGHCPVLYVPEEYPTIQLAINRALDGDEIVVGPGTYPELIDLNGKAIVLRSAEGPGATVIDGSGRGGTVVRGVSGKGPDTVVEGFTITGGTGTLVETFPGDFNVVGGGMHIGGSSPTVRSCVFTGNSAHGDETAPGLGGGLYVAVGSPWIEGCLFLGNTADHGGGVHANLAADVRLEGCTLTGNGADVQGGAAAAGVTSTLTLEACAFGDNTAPIAAGIAAGRTATLAGDGSLSHDVVCTGALRPGPAIATIEGSYVQRVGPNSGSMRVDVGGAGPGPGHDVVQIDGPADLGGGLFVSLLGPEPDAGATFPIITAGTIERGFDVAFLPGLTDKVMRVVYTTPNAAGGEGVVLSVSTLEELLMFGGPAGTGVPGQPTDAVIGDLDGDGFDDLAITIPDASPGQSGSVLVLINDGSGSGFMASQQITVGVDPSSITIGRLDAGASLDLAVANRGDDDVSILINLGDGTFIPPDPADDVPVGAGPSSIASGALTSPPGAGPVDLAVANGDAGFEEITLLFNDGNGAFIASGFDLPGSGFRACIIDPTDLDNDKDLDVAVIGIVQESGAGVINVVENLGGGILGNPLAIPVGQLPSGFGESDKGDDNAGVDLDGNGLSDLVTADFGGGTVSVVLNEGGLAFSPAVALPLDAAPRSLTTLDLGLDGDIDLALIVDDPEEGTLLIALRNDTDGGGQLVFAEPTVIASEPGALFVLSGDLDGDSDEELVTVTGGGAGAASAGDGPAVLVRPNLVLGDAGPCDVDGDGTIGVDDLIALILSWGPCPGCPADTDGDGVVDVDDLVCVILNWTG